MKAVLILSVFLTLVLSSTANAQGFRPTHPYYLDYVYGPPRYYVKRNRVLYEPKRPEYPYRRFPVTTIPLTYQRLKAQQENQ